jgi:YD repeat-containing protein
MCGAAAAGRNSGTTQQSYNNCGVESSRQLINRANGTAISENTLLQQSINSGLANGTPGVAPVLANGGTNPLGRQAILAANGVGSSVMPTTAANLGAAMSQGQGVIVSLDAAPLWGGATPAGSLHAVTVTGVEYDANGNPTAVFINDTGTGQCGQRVPIAVFNQATAAHPSSQLNVTNNPIF